MLAFNRHPKLESAAYLLARHIENHTRKLRRIWWRVKRVEVNRLEKFRRVKARVGKRDKSNQPSQSVVRSSGLIIVWVRDHEPWSRSE